MLEEG
jgi:hypothetical protein